MLIYNILIINILRTFLFFSDIKIEVKMTNDQMTFFRVKVG